MRNILKSIPVLFLFLISACQDKVYETYKASVPVYMTYEDLRNAIHVENPVALKEPGKIYFKDNTVYINEYFKGIHVIDNSNSANPVKKAFINIPGNVDIAIKDNILYADSYIDLVALDISDPNNVTELHRVKDVFPYAVPPKDVNYTEEPVDFSKGVVTGWEIKEITKEVNPQPYPYPFYLEYDYMAKPAFSNSATTGTSSVGTGGSMARFAIRDNALYTLTSYQIKVLDISNTSTPVTKTTLSNLWGIETVFLYQDHMYIGAQNGMSIFNITSPLNPAFVSTYSHITSCDPVVVEGNYAFVTLRSGTWCRNTVTNQLDIIDITDKAHPSLVKSYGFTEPKGLGIDNHTLFLCDGKDGLKIFNATDVLKITQNPISTFKDVKATDVIPVNGLLFMIGDDGFYQYDYSNLSNIKLLSKIEIEE